MGQIQSVAELLNFLRRHWLMIILVTAIGALGSVVFALNRQPYYQATAVIRVEAPRVNPENPGDTVSSSSAATILQGIEQRLTTRKNLIEVIERHGLFADVPGWSIDEKVVLLRRQIRFEGIDSAAGQLYGQARSLSAILIVTNASDPDTAARLANDFAQGILDQSSAGQMEVASETVAFFDEVVARLWAVLSNLEAEVASFKNENAASLPNLQEVGRNELTALDTSVRDLGQQKAALEGQIRALEANENLRETDRRALADLRAQVSLLLLQLDQSQTRRAEVAAALSRLPEVERVLASYERQLGQTQAEYEMATSRLAEAQTTLRLAERGQDGRFALLERAIRPEFAAGGGRKKLVMAGTFVALVAGLGLAFLWDMFRPVVRTSAQMQRQLGIRPVVTIPELAPRQRSNLLRYLPNLVDDPSKLAANLPRPVIIALCIGMAGIMTAFMA